MGWQGYDVPKSGRVESKITPKQDTGQTMSSWTTARGVCPDCCFQKFWLGTGTSAYTEAPLSPTQALTAPADKQALNKLHSVPPCDSVQTTVKLQTPVFKAHCLFSAFFPGCCCGLSTSRCPGSKQTQELLGGVKFQVSLLQLGADEQVSVLEQSRGGMREGPTSPETQTLHISQPRGARMPRNMDSDIQHHPDIGLNTRGLEGKQCFAALSASQDVLVPPATLHFSK